MDQLACQTGELEQFIENQNRLDPNISFRTDQQETPLGEKKKKAKKSQGEKNPPTSPLETLLDRRNIPFNESYVQTFFPISHFNHIEKKRKKRTREKDPHAVTIITYCSFAQTPSSPHHTRQNTTVVAIH